MLLYGRNSAMKATPNSYGEIARQAGGSTSHCTRGGLARGAGPYNRGRNSKDPPLRHHLAAGDAQSSANGHCRANDDRQPTGIVACPGPFRCKRRPHPARPDTSPRQATADPPSWCGRPSYARFDACPVARYFRELRSGGLPYSGIGCFEETNTGSPKAHWTPFWRNAAATQTSSDGRGYGTDPPIDAILPRPVVRKPVRGVLR